MPLPNQQPVELLPPAPPPQVPAQQAWTLPQLTHLALSYNPSIRKAVSEIESARGDAIQSGLYPNPNFDTNNPELVGGQFTVLNVGMTQEIVTKGKLRLNKAAADQVTRQSELAYIRARFDVLSDIRSQYYSILAAERRLAVQRELVKLAGATKKAAEGRVKALEGTETDVLLLTVELQRAETKSINFETTLNGLMRKLSATVGVPELPFTAAQGDLFGPVPHFDDAEIREFIYAGNSDVQRARVDILRNRLLLRRAEVEPFPNPIVAPTYYSGLTTSTVPQQYGLTVMFPIPTWNRNQGNIRSQRGDLEASIANLGTVQNQLLGQAADILARHRAALQMADRLSREILPAAQRSLQLTRSGYDRGLLDISTLLQAQRALIDVNMDLIDAQETVWTTAADLAEILQREQFP